jgi:hypothetical protein
MQIVLMLRVANKPIILVVLKLSLVVLNVLAPLHDELGYFFMVVSYSFRLFMTLATDP